MLNIKLQKMMQQKNINNHSHLNSDLSDQNKLLLPSLDYDEEKIDEKVLNARNIFDEDNGQKKGAKIHKLLEILVFWVFPLCLKNQN